MQALQGAGRARLLQQMVPRMLSRAARTSLYRSTTQPAAPRHVAAAAVAGQR
jgi:hypothetical protein